MLQVGNKTYYGLDLDKAVAQRSFLVLAAFFRETQPPPPSFVPDILHWEEREESELGSAMLSAGSEWNYDSLSDFTERTHSLASWLMTEHML